MSVYQKYVTDLYSPTCKTLVARWRAADGNASHILVAATGEPTVGD